jgi:hypothetical protein
VLNRVPAVSADAQARIFELNKMVGTQSVWKPTIPQRVLINSAHHERSPLHSFGSQARELTDIFDAHLRKLRRVIT